VIGQAFPYTPIANPRYLIPDWSFGIDEDKLAENVARLRDDKVDLVVLLSHNGFDVDRKLASRVKGIDVILTGHTHDALPMPVKVGDTLLIAAGSHGKFLARLDLEISGRRIVDYAFRLIPVLSDVIAPDPDMAALIREVRLPHDAKIAKVLGRTESLLYRRGNFNGTFDDLICQALLTERDAEIALSPGFRWGASLLPDQNIHGDDIFNQTAITYPAAYRSEMTGEYLKQVLEDVADNLFNPDPYLQQGGDMVRAGGLAYTLTIDKPVGQRISDLTLLRTGEKIDAARKYTVSGWASVNEGTEGPAIYDVVSAHVERIRTVRLQPGRRVKVVGADPAGYQPA
jgi:sulfur-oxidizing protein SoxB